MKQNQPYDRSVFQSLTLILQFGINMVVPIVLMAALGIWLDRSLETGFLTVLFFGMGAVAGGQNCYRMAKKIISTPDHSRKRVTEEMLRQGIDASENGKDESVQ